MPDPPGCGRSPLSFLRRVAVSCSHCSGVTYSEMPFSVMKSPAAAFARQSFSSVLAGSADGLSIKSGFSFGPGAAWPGGGLPPPPACTIRAYFPALHGPSLRNPVYWPIPPSTARPTVRWNLRPQAERPAQAPYASWRRGELVEFFWGKDRGSFRYGMPRSS